MNARSTSSAASGIIAALALAAGTATTLAAPPKSITIYSSAAPGAIDPDLYRPRPGYNPGYGNPIPGYALVREDRPIRIEAGRSEVRITDVAALIDPTTVSFRSLTDEDTRVIDQNFQFDLVSTDKLLERFVDQEINAVVTRGNEPAVVSGTLLSAQGGQLILRDRDGAVQVVNGYNGIDLPTLPEGLITRPTLVWNVLSRGAGPQTVRIAYQTQGITWWADYNLVYAEGDNANRGTLDLSAWVSILNQSGASYEETQLKLVAGEVNRAPQQKNVYMMRGAAPASDMAAEAAPEFAEKSFFEYHLYTLSEPTTIPQNSTKQLELFPTARDIPVEKILLYAGQEHVWWGGGPITDQNFGVESKSDVDVYLKFENSKEKGLGMPLPAGRVRVSKVDPDDGGMEFVGEDVIKHTPREEEVLIKMGKAFDVVGSRRQVDFGLDAGRRRMEETIEVEVRNRKETPVEVVVQERMFRHTNWEFVGEAPEHKKLDASTVHFPVRIEPNGKATVRFRVRYWW